MAEQKYQTTPPDIATMPPGIPYIIGNEAAERFSFYGMKHILQKFMTENIRNAEGSLDLMSVPAAAAVVHWFNAAVYLTPLAGSLVADIFFGKYLTIVSLSMLYCVGHLVLALMDAGLGIHQKYLLYAGLALIALGAGGIKPCVSAHVGDQFGSKNKHLTEKVFSWFYFSVNFGSFFSTLLTPWLRVHYGPSVAFGVPGILMAIATLMFWLGRHKYAHIPPSGSVSRFVKDTFNADGRQALANLLPLFLFVAMFWCLFDQSGSRWVSQADHMNRVIWDATGTFAESTVISMKGKEEETSMKGEEASKPVDAKVTLTSDQIQSVNPLLVMLLIPIANYLLYPLMGKFFTVTPLRKIGIGMFLTLPSFLIPAWLETRITAGATPSINWQVLAYIFLTVAEVMISITCLQFSYSQAPKEMKSVILGLYYGGVSLGNIFAALVNGYIERQQHEQNVEVLPGAQYYLFFVACMAINAIVFVVWSQFYKGRSYVQGEATPQKD